jgi:hypothetical protein
MDDQFISEQNPWLISFIEGVESPSKLKKEPKSDISKEEIKKWKEDLNILYNSPNGKYSPQQNNSPVPRLNFDSMKKSPAPVLVLPPSNVGPPPPPPPPGPPSAPPPPPTGLKSKTEMEQDNGLKKLHWETIPMMKAKQSGLWSKVAEKLDDSSPSLEIDKGLLETLFQTKQAVILSPKSKPMTEKEEIQFLDSSKSRNIEILLSSFRRLTDPETFLSIIHSMNLENIEKNEISAMEQCEEKYSY